MKLPVFLFFTLFLTSCVLTNFFVFEGDTGTKENIPVNPAELIEMAEYCRDVYEVTGDNGDEFSWVVTEDQGVTIIIIRGTNNLKNVKSDVDARPFKDKKLDATLHRGFRSAAEEIYQSINKKHQLHDTVYLTGHSLGGAIAMIMGYWYDEDGKTVQIYTFGAPKVSTKYFANSPQHFRVAMVNDPVPFAPPFPYIHSGININPKTLDWRYKNDVGDFTKIDARDHSINAYHKHLIRHNVGEK